jgi:hypothetical protein
MMDSDITTLHDLSFSEAGRANHIRLFLCTCGCAKTTAVLFSTEGKPFASATLTQAQAAMLGRDLIKCSNAGATGETLNG